MMMVWLVLSPRSNQKNTEIPKNIEVESNHATAQETEKVHAKTVSPAR